MSHVLAVLSHDFWPRLFYIGPGACGRPDRRAFSRAFWLGALLQVLAALIGALPGLVVAAHSHGLLRLARELLAGNFSVLPPLVYLGAFAATYVPVYFYIDAVVPEFRRCRDTRRLAFTSTGQGPVLRPVWLMVPCCWSTSGAG